MILVRLNSSDLSSKLHYLKSFGSSLIDSYRLNVKIFKVKIEGLDECNDNIGFETKHRKNFQQ